MQIHIDAIKKADRLEAEVTAFFCASVGREVNQLERLSLLIEWHDAIEDAVQGALELRSWPDVDRLDAMRDEAEMWLDHEKEVA